jgi:putative Holliday junction resolvase
MELREAVPAGQRLIGLDVGTKTIGLALSDTRRVIATARNHPPPPFRHDTALLFALVALTASAGW